MLHFRCPRTDLSPRLPITSWLPKFCSIVRSSTTNNRDTMGAREREGQEDSNPVGAH